jgi:DNA-binding SARP family transcriptional activator
MFALSSAGVSIVPTLHVHTLGDLRLVRASGEAVALRRKPLALLAYLARRAPRAVARTELATLIWGDRAEDRARQSLRQALLELKQVVGDALEATPDEVRLADGAVTMDVVELERDAREGRPEAAVARWEGAFFPDVASVGGDAFERWVEGERITLLRRLSAVMEQLIGAAELRKDWRGAAAWAARWAAQAPFDERAHGRLIEALRMEGRASEALDRHAELVARLRESLDVDPSPEFMRLAGGLHEQARTEAARRERPSTAVRVPTLVGRGHELAELATAWRAATEGAPALVLVDDDGGGGKTRLCDELAHIAAEHPDGAVVLRHAGRAPEDGAYPSASRLFAGLRDAPGTAGAAPEALAEVARLVPSLAAAYRHLPAPVGDEDALRDALVQVLAAVSEETPVLVVLDDAHLADPASRALVASIASRLPARVMMLLLGDAGSRTPGGVVDSLLAIPGVLRIRLRPLTVPEVEAMVASMVSVAEDERAALAGRLHEQAGGTPYLVYEYLSALVDERLLTLDHGGAWRVSPSLDGRPLPLPNAVCERVGRALAPLSPPARALVDSAAVVGTPIDSMLLEAVSGLSGDAAAAGLREVAARRVMREDAATGQVDFTHAILARVAYALLSPSERRARHARAAEEMAARDMTTTAERSVLPYHLARAATVPAESAPEAVAAPVATAAAPGVWRRRRRVLLGAGLAAAVAAAALGAARTLGRSPARAERAAETRRVVVGAFQNRSGRPELDRVRDIATDWIVRGLGETGLVEIVGTRAGPDDVVGSSARLTTDRELRAAAAAAHAGTIVTGTLYQVGDSVELEAVLMDARDGSLLRALPAVRAAAADPLGAVDRLRRQVVGALAAMVDPEYGAGGVSTRPPPSYEAYLAFMRGEQAYQTGTAERAIDEYRRAAAADSTYFLPVLRLAYVSFRTDRCDRVDSVARVLGPRRAQLSRFENYYLDRVEAWCRSDWNGAFEAARRMADLPPRSPFAQFAAANSALSANYPREAVRRLDAVDSARGWVPLFGRHWLSLAAALHLAGDDARLRVVAQRLGTLQRDRYTVAAQVYAAGALGRADALAPVASEFVAIVMTQEPAALATLQIALDELRVHGSRAEAEALSARLGTQIGAAAPAGVQGDTVRFIAAELLYRAGRWRDAYDVAVALTPTNPGSVFVLSLRGRAAARLGARAEARRVFDELGRLSSRSLSGINIYGQAEIAAIQGERAEAVRLLRTAAASGVQYMFDFTAAHLGHADPDLESIMDDPEVRALLRPKG